MSNPRRRRRHRRNPSLPKWAIGALAVALAAAGYAVVNAGSYALTQRLDPSLDTAVRNRYIASALCIGGGLLLASKSPLLGIGLAAGGAIAAVGSKVTALLSSVVDSGGTDAAKKIGAVYGQMGAYAPYMGAVYGNNMAGYERQMGRMGAVYANNLSGLGNYVPPAPWHAAGPF
jgi:hypothetical protein